MCVNCESFLLEILGLPLSTKTRKKKDWHLFQRSRGRQRDSQKVSASSTQGNMIVHSKIEGGGVRSATKHSRSNTLKLLMSKDNWIAEISSLADPSEKTPI